MFWCSARVSPRTCCAFHHVVPVAYCSFSWPPSQDSLGFWIPETYLRSSSFVVAAQSVSYQLIYYLARGLGKNWRDLGRTLGISVRKLSEIDRKTELLDHEKGMTMLQEWKVRLGDDATVEVLQDALKDLRIKDPALKLKSGM